MRRIAQLCDIADDINDRVGRATAWLLLPVILLLFAQIPLREWIGKGNLLANDFGQLLHATVFMIGAAYTLRWDGHVRVDLLRGRMGARGRAWVDLLGASLFILPWLAWVGWWSIPTTWRSWLVLERFPETFNPGYFHFKTLLLAFVLLVGLRTLVMIARAAMVLAGPRA